MMDKGREKGTRQINMRTRTEYTELKMMGKRKKNRLRDGERKYKRNGTLQSLFQYGKF